MYTMATEQQCSNSKNFRTDVSKHSVGSRLKPHSDFGSRPDLKNDWLGSCMESTLQRVGAKKGRSKLSSRGKGVVRMDK